MTEMKATLTREYNKADLDGKAVLQPIIDELCELLASGRTYIKIKELLGSHLKEKKKEPLGK